VVKEKPTGPVAIPAQIVVKDLADLLHTTPTEVISDLIKKHSVFANINQVIDYEKAALVAQDLGFEPTQSVAVATPAVQRVRESSGALAAKEGSEAQKGLVPIPPVVTIMGHVDHGKTTLLDTIRKTKVAASEVGGITQHIGAYQVEVQGKKITFLDTPGHEAFTAMRARGAQVTHIAVIVVAADDGVMPQTREAIDHARAANVPIIIALNKMDKPDANPDYVKQQLAEIGVVVEDYGGDVICVPVSARKGTGIDDLLEMILLLAEMQDIRGDPNQLASGTIIEARLEKSSGPTATVLVQNGTLKMGDNIVVGTMAGKVRAMFNDRGKRIQKASPSTPVSILGLPEVPQAGDHLEAVSDERTARQLAEQRRNESRQSGQVSLDTLYAQMQQGSVKELNIVLKSDVQGSAEAIKHALTRVGDENLKVRLIHEGVGNISETDVHLAGASGAIIIGFNVRADGAAQRLAQEEGVDIRYYNIIYKLLDDIEAALSGMLEPTYREVIEGHAEIQQTFKTGKNIVIAGCRVLDGKITRSSRARILRNQERVFDGKIASLRRGKDDVREVAAGYECGIVLEDYNSFEIGDIVECYAQEKVKPGA
jgi:translation initiation factor IF-2